MFHTLVTILLISAERVKDILMMLNSLSDDPQIASDLLTSLTKKFPGASERRMRISKIRENFPSSCQGYADYFHKRGEKPSDESYFLDFNGENILTLCKFEYNSDRSLLHGWTKISDMESLKNFIRVYSSNANVKYLDDGINVERSNFNSTTTEIRPTLFLAQVKNGINWKRIRFTQDFYDVIYAYSILGAEKIPRGYREVVPSGNLLPLTSVEKILYEAGMGSLNGSNNLNLDYLDYVNTFYRLKFAEAHQDSVEKDADPDFWIWRQRKERKIRVELDRNLERKDESGAILPAGIFTYMDYGGQGSTAGGSFSVSDIWIN